MFVEQYGAHSVVFDTEYADLEISFSIKYSTHSHFLTSWRAFQKDSVQNAVVRGCIKYIFFLPHSENVPYPIGESNCNALFDDEGEWFAFSLDHNIHVSHFPQDI